MRSTDSERKSAGSACNIHLNHACKSVENNALFLLFAYFFFLLFQRRKSKNYFVIKKIFLNVLFFLFICEVKRKKRTKRKRKHATASYALTSVDKMDVASRACTLSLAIGATHVNILSASISKIQNFIFSMQACLKVTSQFRTHVRGAIVVQINNFHL